MNLMTNPKPIPTNIDATINKGDFSKNTSPTPITISVIAPITNRLLFLFLFGFFIFIDLPLQDMNYSTKLRVGIFVMNRYQDQ